MAETLKSTAKGFVYGFCMEKLSHKVEQYFSVQASQDATSN
jgi:hypothetical protein